MLVACGVATSLPPYESPEMGRCRPIRAGWSAHNRFFEYSRTRMKMKIQSFKPSAIFSAGVSFLRLRSGLELFASTIKLVECCIFYMEKVDEDANLEFKWLIKKGRGGKNKEVQFYGSFIYDGVKYVLYDCVYMYKEGLREPYIGKLTKIWENADKSKKVKVHWFFRPEEISKWLGDTKTLENEILFASGEGVGLTNISPLEAIAGKCNVVCVSKDSRNPQPSDEQLKAADFIFYRTFDVESCTILDNMDEKIGGIEIKHIFNRREDESISTLPETTTTTTSTDNTITITTSTSSEPKQLLLTKTLPNSNNLKDDDAQDKNIPILAAEITSVALLEKTNPKIDEKADKHAMEANKRKKSSTTGSDKLHEQPSKKMKLDDKNLPKEKQVEVVEVDRDSVGLKDVIVMPSKKSKVDNNVRTGGKNSEIGKTDTSVVKTDKDNMKSSKDKDETKVSKVSTVDKERKKTPMESDKLDDRPLKKMKSKVANEKQKQVEVEGEKIEKLTDLSSKKSKVEDKSAPNEKQKQVEVEGEKIEKLTDLPSKKSKDEVKSPRNVNNLGTSGTQEEKANGKNNYNKGKISDELEGRRLKKTKAEGSFKIPDNKKNSSSTINSNGKNLLVASEGKSKSVVVNNNNKENQSESNESKKKLSMSQSPKDMYKEFVVGPKPNADESGWFERLPWEQSLKSAYDQGSAILLHNVDPDYTSGEVEDLVWHAFTENCEAKILPHSVISSPHCYQALVLLKTKEAAQRVLAKLDEDCLMLSNGRPLVGTPCPPIIPRKTCKFFGHLSIDRIKINQREMEEAVSTSHFSQPNTIEYDMAMEWFLMQSKSIKWWEMIHKLQGNEFRNSFEEKIRVCTAPP
ncbi:unnamed protein product [Lactuca virosa]|uniref:BAH domain-containing protein n=1 Tax=Lactuca virosa TaxID=75947 RepID=A0AAU9PNC7_9ASTR|nr:unnamed protein product [Lactuca virosa]